jgi:hypothetical protein
MLEAIGLTKAYSGNLALRGPGLATLALPFLAFWGVGLIGLRRYRIAG